MDLVSRAVHRRVCNRVTHDVRRVRCRLASRYLTTSRNWTAFWYPSRAFRPMRNGDAVHLSIFLRVLRAVRC
jgi:hypothetical protein